MPEVTNPPTPKQLSYIEALMRDKEGATDLKEDYDSMETFKDAGQLISKLRDLPYKPRDMSNRITEDGMYKNPETGEIYKVQRNKAQGDGSRLYAKMLILNQGPFYNNEGKETSPYRVKFEYVTGLIIKIKPEWKMTLAQAEEFGSLYGICVRCGRDLTREESIARAMGPICYESFV